MDFFFFCLCYVFGWDTCLVHVKRYEHAMHSSEKCPVHNITALCTVYYQFSQCQINFTIALILIIVHMMLPFDLNLKAVLTQGYISKVKVLSLFMTFEFNLGRRYSVQCLKVIPTLLWLFWIFNCDNFKLNVHCTMMTT